MNTNGLAKLYDRLMPRERLPLIIAAWERGDEAEADRLSRSAPRNQVRLPDYHGLGEGLILLTLFHIIGQLELGLLYLHSSTLAEHWLEVATTKKDNARGERMGEVARLLACRMCIEADAWTQLGAEMNIDLEGLLRDMPAYDTLRRTVEDARLSACTAEEIAACLRRKGSPEAQAPTVEDATKALRQFLDARIAWWG